MQQDAIFMARAIQLARLGRYTTDPNPRVGCVLVKDAQIIAEGWHARAGQGHAEVVALQQIETAQGATAYVTLEPCSHFGKTPPCCDALIAAGVARVVVAMQDPNPLVAGAGLKKLQAAGITVDAGLMQCDAEQLNRGFIKRMRTGLPFVCTKLAMSLDGRTAMASGESKWITSSQAREDVQRLRAASSAILTGINTVLSDDPALNARVDFPVTQPVRVVLDSRLAMPVHAKMGALPGRSLILTGSIDQVKIKALQAVGFEVHTLPLKNARLDLTAVLVFLGQQQINDVLVEAGATLNGALLAEGLLDEGVVYMAPSIMGDAGRGLFSMPQLQRMLDKKNVQWQDVRRVGADLRLTITFQGSS
ncbi:MAG: bifunctional diaminohydroxyphosphoribosylaminopyrimidine deaminase/5-amino-6-(5-phosphoribosylamino)uracil reductase RibD [Methylococcaceae bacterium]